MKVRYHLQRGPNYMHWQFRDSGIVWYAEPSKHTIKLKNCILHNNIKLAEKIYLGKNKDVCAWIKCKEYEVLPADFQVFTKLPDSFPDSPYGRMGDIVESCTHLRYNPKDLPYWHTISGRNIDGLAFDELYLTEQGVFYNELRDDVHNPLK